MTTPAEQLRQAADTVARLGCSSADLEALPDRAVLTGQREIAEARRLIEMYAAWMAATIARRSRPELGHAGLAAQQGFLSPEAMIQKVTGSSKNEAFKLVAVGTILAQAEAADRLTADTLGASGSSGSPGDGGDPSDDPAAFPPDSAAVVSWQAPIARAVTNGTLSVDAAESIRKGLGDIDTAVTADKLAVALTRLLAESVELNADECFTRARRMRDNLDSAGIAAREKQAYDDRYLKIYRLQGGQVRLNGLFAPEDGEFVLSTYDSITSPRRGGVRFVDKDRAAWAKRIQDDPRSTAQIAADSFVQLLKIAGEVDSGRMLGGRRPAVRVIVTQKDLADFAAARAGAAPTASASESGQGYLEGSPASISLAAVERQLCDTGDLGILLDSNGKPLDVGREQRLFTQQQRTAMGMRDGGCVWPGCDRPPAWTEAHHLKQWLIDHGLTDLADGVCLCHPHHLLLHNTGWVILRDGDTYWLKPPVSVDPNQTLIPLASKAKPPLDTITPKPERETG